MATTELRELRDIHFADSKWEKTKGLHGVELTDETALVFRWDAPATRKMQTYTYPADIDVYWLHKGVLVRTARLHRRSRFWQGCIAEAYGDTVIETKADATDALEVGDRVRITETAIETLE